MFGAPKARHAHQFFAIWTGRHTTLTIAISTIFAEDSGWILFASKANEVIGGVELIIRIRVEEEEGDGRLKDV